jgi:hypothetical protein
MLTRAFRDSLAHCSNEGLVATAEACLLLYASFQHGGVQLPMVSPFQAHHRSNAYKPNPERRKQESLESRRKNQQQQQQQPLQQRQQHQQQHHQQQQQLWKHQRPRQQQYPWKPALPQNIVLVEHKDSKEGIAAKHVISITSSTSSSCTRGRSFKAAQNQPQNPAGATGVAAQVFPSSVSSQIGISRDRIGGDSSTEVPMGGPSFLDTDHPLPASLGCVDPSSEAAVPASAAGLPPGQLMSLIQAARTLEDMEDLLRLHHTSFT